MIYLGSDHRGYKLKESLKKYLDNLAYKYEDLGNTVYDPNDDYPDFSKLVGEKVIGDPGSRGILICGSGIGVCIAANKIKGIRAGTMSDPEQAKISVNDEDTNILCLSADYASEEKNLEIVKSFLEAKYSGEERHARRVEKIKKLETND